jgi:hypothetical protein
VTEQVTGVDLVRTQLLLASGDKLPFTQADLSLKGSYADVSQWTQSGVYGQVKWDYSNRLALQAGLRYDWSTSSSRPVLNRQFLSDTGMRNDGTVDGATDISPRLGFNWSLNEERSLQIRGGAGYFLGRAPWVFWSNSYGQTGTGTYTVSTLPTGGLNGYLTNNFDPANPMGTGTQTASGPVYDFFTIDD